MELHESVVEAALRELFEETGIAAVPVRILQVQELATRTDAYAITTVLVSPRWLEPRPASDATDARWISPSHVPRLSLAPGVETLLRRLRLYGGPIPADQTSS